MSRVVDVFILPKSALPSLDWLCFIQLCEPCTESEKNWAEGLWKIVVYPSDKRLKISSKCTAKEEFSRYTMRSVSLFKKEWVTRARAASEKMKWNTKMCSRKEKLASTSSVFAGLSEKWTESLFDRSLDRRVARNSKKKNACNEFENWTREPTKWW